MMETISPRCERELNRYICCLTNDGMTSEQKHIALLSSLKELESEKDSWRLTQLYNAVQMAWVLENLPSLPPIFVYRSEFHLILWQPRERRLKLLPLASRAPPSESIFTPIPHKTELGSCARSDLVVSAF